MTEAFLESGEGHWAAMQFLIEPDPNLETTPMDALKGGRVEAVMAAAQAYLGLAETPVGRKRKRVIATAGRTYEFPAGLSPYDIAAGETVVRVHRVTDGPLWFGPAPGSPPACRFDAPAR